MKLEARAPRWLGASASRAIPHLRGMSTENAAAETFHAARDGTHDWCPSPVWPNHQPGVIFADCQLTPRAAIYSSISRRHVAFMLHGAAAAQSYSLEINGIMLHFWTWDAT